MPALLVAIATASDASEHWSSAASLQGSFQCFQFRILGLQLWEKAAHSSWRQLWKCQAHGELRVLGLLAVFVNEGPFWPEASLCIELHWHLTPCFECLSGRPLALHSSLAYSQGFHFPFLCWSSSPKMLTVPRFSSSFWEGAQLYAAPSEKVSKRHLSAFEHWEKHNPNALLPLKSYANISQSLQGESISSPPFLQMGNCGRETRLRPLRAKYQSP